MAKRIEVSQDVRLGAFEGQEVLGVERVYGSDFEQLVDKIHQRISNVSVAGEELKVNLRGDISWHHGVISRTGRESQDMASLKLIARAATHIAARKHLEGPYNSIGLTVEEIELGGEASKDTNRWPWSNNGGDAKARWGLRPISLREAFRESPEALIDASKARLVQQRTFPFAILSSAAALAACTSLAKNTPVEVYYTETPEQDPSPEVSEPDFSQLEEAAGRLSGMSVEIQSVIPGLLSDDKGENYTIANATWINSAGSDRSLPLLVQVDGQGQVMDVDGLALDEASSGEEESVFVGFDLEGEDKAVITNRYIRLNSETGVIQISNDMKDWSDLSGEKETIEDIGRGLGVQAALAIQDSTPPLEFPPTLGEETEKGAPGDILLGPEAILEGKVEIDKEKEKAFMDIFYYTVVKTNPEYFGSLTLSDGKRVTDAETFRKYSEENGWVYDGTRISTPRLWNKGPGKNYIQLKPLDGPVSLRNLSLEFIDYDVYQAVIADYKTEDKMKESRANFLFYTLANPQIGAPIIVGFVPRWQNDHYILAFQVVNYQDPEGKYMPRLNEHLSLTQENVDDFNTYISYAMYAWRAMYIGTPVEQLAGEKYYKADGLMGQLYKINPETKVAGRLDEVGFFYEKFIENGLPSDAPPPLLDIQ